jgi:hypothetical protein
MKVPSARRRAMYLESEDSVAESFEEYTSSHTILWIGRRASIMKAAMEVV